MQCGPWMQMPPAAALLLRNLAFVPVGKSRSRLCERAGGCGKITVPSSNPIPECSMAGCCLSMCPNCRCRGLRTLADWRGEGGALPNYHTSATSSRSLRKGTTGRVPEIDKW